MTDDLIYRPVKDQGITSIPEKLVYLSLHIKTMKTYHRRKIFNLIIIPVDCRLAEITYVQQDLGKQ